MQNLADKAVYLLLYKALICIKSSVNMDDFTPKSR